jgi:hypothetical protein
MLIAPGDRLVGFGPTMKEGERRGESATGQSSSQEYQPSVLEERRLSNPDTVSHARRDAKGFYAFEMMDSAGLHFR